MALTERTDGEETEYQIIPGFSCLAMKRQGHNLLHEKLEGMSGDKKLAYGTSVTKNC